MSLPTVTVEIDFGGSVGVVDVTTYHDAAVGLEVTQGRPGIGQPAAPGTLSLQLFNDDGRFTPDNPASPYWPQVTDRVTVTVTATKGGDSRVLFSGKVTDWQPEFPDGDTARAFVTVSAVDALGDLAARTLRHIHHERVMAPDGVLSFPALHYWPLDEPPGADGADNLAGGESLFIRGNGGTLSFEDGELTLVPPVSGATFTRSSASVGRYLRGRATGGASAATSFEFMTWVQLTAVTSGVVGVSEMTLADGTKVSLVLNGGIPQASVVRPGGSVSLSTSLSGLSALSLDVPHMIDVQMAEEFGGEWVLYVFIDAADMGTDSTFSDPGTWNLSTVTVELGRAPSVVGAGFLTAATIGGFGVADVAPTFNYYNLWEKGLSTSQQVYGLDTTQTRAALLGAAAGLGTHYPSADATPEDVGNQDFEGMTALDAMVEAYGHRGAYIQATFDANVFDVRGSSDARPSDPALTLDAEDDLVGTPVFSRADFGKVAIANVRGFMGSTTYRDATLVADIGPVEAEPLSSPLFYYGDRFEAAADRVAQGRYARLRPQRVTFDLHSSANDLYPDWLGAYAWRIGSRIRLGGLPAAMFGYTTIDGYLEGYTERLSLSGYEVTVDLSSTEPEEAEYDTDRYAFGDGVCTCSAIDADDTSVTLTWTGGAALSTTSGDYPMDLDINGERVTVSSAPGGSSSPQTVTIVRGVGGTVARAHSSGEPVEVWTRRYAYGKATPPPLEVG